MTRTELIKECQTLHGVVDELTNELKRKEEELMRRLPEIDWSKAFTVTVGLQTKKKP